MNKWNPWAGEMVFAWAVVERMSRTHGIHLHIGPSMAGITYCCERTDNFEYGGEADLVFAATPARAICLAAVKALNIDIDAEDAKAEEKITDLGNERMVR